MEVEEKKAVPEILPKDALKGLRIGISVSESPDLGQLGLLEGHFRLALGEIARSVLVSGGRLAYGGYLDPEGYTSFLRKELQKYGRRDRPLLICLAWQEHRKLALSRLDEHRRDLGLYGEIVCLDSAGEAIDPSDGRGEVPEPVTDQDVRAQALTALRQYMARRTDGRVLIGGKRQGFQGTLPGLMEEALATLDAGKPLYLAAGFGGVTANVAQALRVDDCAWLPRRTETPSDDARLVEGRRRLGALADRSTWKGLENGLSREENRRLAASHRPSDIAALVSLGLGRLNLVGGRSTARAKLAKGAGSQSISKGRPPGRRPR